MAKVSAHGKELARIEKEIELSSGTKCTSFLALFEDGVILQKDTYRGDTTRYGTWRIYGRKSKHTAETFIAAGAKHGFKVSA